MKLRLSKDTLYNAGGIAFAMLLVIGIGTLISFPLVAMDQGNGWWLLFLPVSAAAIYFGLLGMQKMLDKLYPWRVR